MAPPRAVCYGGQGTADDAQAPRRGAARRPLSDHGPFGCAAAPGGRAGGRGRGSEAGKEARQGEKMARKGAEQGQGRERLLVEYLKELFTAWEAQLCDPVRM